MIYRQYLFKDRLPLLNKGLDAFALRQKTIAKNIANVTTPEYKPEVVRFEEYFKDATSSVKGITTDEKHFNIGANDDKNIEGETEERVIPQSDVYFSGDSHVNIDKEMSDLAQNQIKYRFAARAVKSYFAGIQSAISGTR